jgi:hypothetical protein
MVLNVVRPQLMPAASESSQLSLINLFLLRISASNCFRLVAFVKE